MELAAHLSRNLRSARGAPNLVPVAPRDWLERRRLRKTGVAVGGGLKAIRTSGSCAPSLSSCDWLTGRSPVEAPRRRQPALIECGHISEMGGFLIGIASPIKHSQTCSVRLRARTVLACRRFSHSVLSVPRPGELRPWRIVALTQPHVIHHRKRIWSGKIKPTGGPETT